jgi:hypothetical protein
MTTLSSRRNRSKIVIALPVVRSDAATKDTARPGQGCRVPRRKTAAITAHATAEIGSEAGEKPTVDMSRRCRPARTPDTATTPRWWRR